MQGEVCDVPRRILGTVLAQCLAGQGIHDLPVLVVLRRYFLPHRAAQRDSTKTSFTRHVTRHVRLTDTDNTYLPEMCSPDPQMGRGVHFSGS